MGPSGKPNIIFITFDSGRADHMGFLGYREKTTPFLDSLAAKGVYFKRAYSTGPSSAVSFAGILTSTYSLDYGGYSYIDKPRVLLSEVLRGDGYFTVGIHSSPYLSAYFGYERGWDEFRYLTYFGGSKQGHGSGGAERATSPGSRKGTEKVRVVHKKSVSTYRWFRKYFPPLAIFYGAGRKLFLLLRKVLKDIVDFKPAFYTADEINEEVKRVLPRRPAQPLFLWLHYLDAHGPYALFARKKGGIWLKIKYYLGDTLFFLFSETPFINRLIAPLLINLYDISLRYVDEHARRLLEYLKSLGVDETNSIFVICADHGEAFLEHGSLGHSPMLFNANINVPLIFYGPRYISGPAGVERPVSLLDVSPTILRLAGAEIPDSYRGKNLFDGEERDVVSQASESEADLTGVAFAGIVIIRNGHKLIHHNDQRYLFSLDDTREKKNLYDEKKEIVEILEARLEAYKP